MAWIPNLFLRFVLLLLMAEPIWAGPEVFLFPGIHYQRIIRISGHQNNCFFNAIRHFGIPISREYLIRRLEESRQTLRWQNAVGFLVQQELLSGDFEHIAHIEDMYTWFLDQIRNDAPITFGAYRSAEDDPDLIDLLGEDLGFDVRITQPESAQHIRIIRDFRHPESANRTRITLQYTSGPVGHFDLVLESNREFVNPYSVFYQIGPPLGEGHQGSVYLATDQNQTFAIKIIRTAKQHQVHFANNEIYP